MQRVKTNQETFGSIFLLQANKWALGSEKIVVLGQKICRACLRMLQVVSADDATTTTSSYTESEVETPTCIQLWILKL